MPSGDMTQLETMKREIEAQDQAWQRMMLTLSGLGDSLLAVPRDVLDALTAITNPPAWVAGTGVRG